VEFLIREATQEDYQQLCGLFAEVDAFHTQALPHVFQDPGEPARTKEFVANILADEDATLFVAENTDDGQVIGFVQVAIRQAPDVPILVPRQLGWISDVVVRKDWRRFGVGRSLMEQAQQWVLDQGVTMVQLIVWEFNQAAVAFYEKLGYTTASRMMWRALDSF
jgi:ribosomal protein S18 acetylase RimI-like enzyme